MPKAENCRGCRQDYLRGAERCPHCGRPGLFPNVQAAEDPEERRALDLPFQEARAEARRCGALGVLGRYQKAVERSEAVISRPLPEVQRLANSDNDLYASYYGLVDAGVRVPAGDEWNQIRAIADDALFPGYKQHIRMAALSLDGRGLPNYGACTLVLREEMIAHRASVFEGNTVLWLRKLGGALWDPDSLPSGYRATWEDRGKLAAVKAVGLVGSATSPAEFAGILLRRGATSAQDEYVEVHIWGPLTRRSAREVTLSGLRARTGQAVARSLREKLVDAGVRVRIVT